MKSCPYRRSSLVVKRGRNCSGSQRFLCRDCGRTFTPEPTQQGYPVEGSTGQYNST